jgi:predicted TIM-barrel fold metal-dependent hydrolase
MFKMMNQSLDAKLKMLKDAGIDRGVFIGLDLAPDFDFKIPIEYLAELQRKHPNEITAFPALNPKKGIDAALDDIEEMAASGIKGFKAFPCFWGDPSDRRYYPLWERAVDKGLVAMFHMGSQIAPGSAAEVVSALPPRRRRHGLPEPADRHRAHGLAVDRGDGDGPRAQEPQRVLRHRSAPAEPALR